METNIIFVDERIIQLQSSMKKSKKEVDECHQKILYLEAYSRLDYRLVVVGELACLSDLESFTVGGIPPSRSYLGGQVKG